MGLDRICKRKKNLPASRQLQEQAAVASIIAANLLIRHASNVFAGWVLKQQYRPSSNTVTPRGPCATVYRYIGTTLTIGRISSLFILSRRILQRVPLLSPSRSVVRALLFSALRRPRAVTLDACTKTRRTQARSPVSKTCGGAGAAFVWKRAPRSNAPQRLRRAVRIGPVRDKTQIRSGGTAQTARRLGRCTSCFRTVRGTPCSRRVCLSPANPIAPAKSRAHGKTASKEAPYG